MISRLPNFTFLDNRKVTFVPLGGRFNKDRFAVLYTEDYLDLLERGISPNWFTIGDTVCAYGPASIRLQIARLLRIAEKGEVMHYQDGNGLNLRRENLVTRKGFSRLDHLDRLADAQRLVQEACQ